MWPRPVGQAALYGLAGDIVSTVEPHTEADPAAVLVQLLVAFGNVVGRTPHFVAESDRHYPNLYVALVGETAKGRKGSSWGHIPRLFGLAAGPRKAGFVPNRSTVDPLSLTVSSGLSSGEGLIWAVRDAIKTGKDKGPGVPDKRLVVLESEFASPLRVMERDGNTLSPVIRHAWDSGDLATLTKNSPARATGAHISIIGHVTKDELLRELSRTEAANGFANRFLWVCVRRSKVLPEGGNLTDDLLRPLADRLGAAIRFGRAVRRMERDQDARVLWATVYPDLSEGKPGLLGAVIARAEAQVMRLACIYALLDESNEIHTVHLEAALAIWRYAEESARFVFGDALGDPVADDILRALRTAGSAGMTRTQIRDLFGRNRKGQDVGRALSALAERGLATHTAEPTGGRTTERWHATTTTA